LKLLGRLLVLPFKIVFGTLISVFRVGRLAGSLPVRMTTRTTRLLKVRGTLALLVGIALGLLFARKPGRELRAQLRARWSGRAGVGDAELADRVRFELEHAPRTWHLAQPTVTVVQGRVVLSGRVTDLEVSDELARVAAAVPGVANVDNLLAVLDQPELPGHQTAD
jgi:hypothetical protein